MAKEDSKPTILADTFVKYDGCDEPEKFTNFQELMVRVEVLSEVVKTISDILRKNNIAMEEIIDAPYIDEDDVYDRLLDN